VLRAVQVSLHVERRVAECRTGLGSAVRQCRGKLVQGIHTTEASTTTSRRGLDEQRQTYLLDDVTRAGPVANGPARNDGQAQS